MEQTYTDISYTEADIQQTYLAQLMKDTKWTFQNKTPFKIRLTYRPLHIDPAGTNLSYRPALLGVLEKNQSKTFTHDSEVRLLTAGGVVEVDPPVLLEKYVLDPKYKKILVGTAVYDIGGPGQNFHNLYADIPGIHIINHFPFPVNIYYKGNLAAQVEKYDGLTYQGGSWATVYFNNTGDGFRFMDVISFEKYNGPFLYSIQLIDTHIQNIHIGVMSPISEYFEPWLEQSP